MEISIVTFLCYPRDMFECFFVLQLNVVNEWILPK